MCNIIPYLQLCTPWGTMVYKFAKKNLFLKHGVQNSHCFTWVCVQCKVFTWFVHIMVKKMLAALHICYNFIIKSLKILLIVIILHM